MLPEHERREMQGRFATYRRTGDTTIRDELVHDHLRLAAHLASRFANRGVATDDLMQVASIGLLQAVERYEPERGLEFSTFATPTIMGELKRHFRDKGWAIRVPRRVQELHLRLNVVVGEMTHQLGRSPTIAELAHATRTSEEDVLEALDAAHAYRTTSIDAPGPGGERRDAREPVCDDDHLFRSEDRLVIETLLSTLEPREQLMVRLRFYEEMTQSEIATRL
ncbi:MAG: sigma-70 family RNA polymerase sigma factor, partial [Aquihabitans sp.]